MEEFKIKEIEIEGNGKITGSEIYYCFDEEKNFWIRDNDFERVLDNKIFWDKFIGEDVSRYSLHEDRKKADVKENKMIKENDNKDEVIEQILIEMYKTKERVEDLEIKNENLKRRVKTAEFGLRRCEEERNLLDDILQIYVSRKDIEGRLPSIESRIEDYKSERLEKRKALINKVK